MCVLSSCCFIVVFLSLFVLYCTVRLLPLRRIKIDIMKEGNFSLTARFVECQLILFAKLWVDENRPTTHTVHIDRSGDRLRQQPTPSYRNAHSDGAVLLSSVRLSVRNVDVPWAYIGWTCSKLITRIISLDSSLLGAPQHRQSSPRGTPLKFGWNRGGIALLSRKPAISLKRGKIGPRLLLMTNRKSHTRFRLVPKSTTLDDLEGPLRIPLQNICVFRGNHENLNEDRPILSATKM